MELKLTVPDAPFADGKFVTDGYRIFRVESSWLTGTFNNYAHEGMLSLTLQEGVTDNRLTDIRPGTLFVYSWEDTKEEGFEFVECEYEGEVVTPDTEENIGERLDKWTARKVN